MDPAVNAANAALYQLNNRQRLYLRFKRAADFIFALAGLVVVLVPFGVIALLQKINEPKEPVFFVQERYGKGGVPFHILKFRSIKSGGSITKFGSFLRKSSIDELPQLLQVITGKMSLVGPRPLILQEEDMHRMRLECGIYQLRPGITGWAQVNGRDNVTNEVKIAYDRQYLENLCLNMDVSILWKTMNTIVRVPGR